MSPNKLMDYTGKDKMHFSGATEEWHWGAVGSERR